jgi:hypothetical protein
MTENHHTPDRSPSRIRFVVEAWHVRFVVEAWHVLPTVLTFDRPHNSVGFYWQVRKLSNAN